ncbi:hypothetical protein DPMN_132402 [Dreissena polymorpha]|uniref:Uncharacterized protein n=1 Tax=Dreissena polymorpha TaxID=45954 RepID=A0A9D4FWN6_DREPO|nr:hypothetical protein DPMN_132402 [Dreissena polymorpha]
MSDDAQKLPFRTNSNFRFLFSSDTRHSQDEPQVALPVSRSAQAFQTNHALLESA